MTNSSLDLVTTHHTGDHVQGIFPYQESGEEAKHASVRFATTRQRLTEFSLLKSRCCRYSSSFGKTTAIFHGYTDVYPCSRNTIGRNGACNKLCHKMGHIFGKGSETEGKNCYITRTILWRVRENATGALQTSRSGLCRIMMIHSSESETVLILSGRYTTRGGPG